MALTLDSIFPFLKRKPRRVRLEADERPVEQATAAPGEKRYLRPAVTTYTDHRPLSLSDERPDGEVPLQ